GTSAPGKSLASLDVPMKGFTRSAGDDTRWTARAGAAQATGAGRAYAPRRVAPAATPRTVRIRWPRGGLLRVPSRWPPAGVENIALGLLRGMRWGAHRAVRTQADGDNVVGRHFWITGDNVVQPLTEFLSIERAPLGVCPSSGRRRTLGIPLASPDAVRHTGSE